jgi:hypothetical protein
LGERKWEKNFLVREPPWEERGERGESSKIELKTNERWTVVFHLWRTTVAVFFLKKKDDKRSDMGIFGCKCSKFD